ncbi:exodeoxyribonuclease III, partial [Brevundimonas sp.]|uniref:exodeoxyribonuclease III n=1 Tax=Brevundimonas sp. TaxID=1871086 RepID=UPI0017E14BEA
MRIATWNVNSVNARLPTVLAWLEAARPDVVGFQEIKCLDEKFPREAFESLGYNVETNGQKTYNGVALLSKYPLSDVRRGLPGVDASGFEAEFEQARYIEAVIETPRPVRVGCLYLPNGNPIGTEKFAYKLAWMDRLQAHARDLLRQEEAFTLCGDYNVIPTPDDAKNPAAWMAHYNLGRLLLDEGRDAEAMMCFEQTVAANPQHALGYNNWGHLLKSQAEG